VKNKLTLYASCIPVKGSTKGTICDLQRNDIYQIPIVVYDVLTKHIGYSIDDIKSCYEKEKHDIIDHYIKLLIEKELIFFTDNPDLFPKLSLQWDEPFLITNAIIDITNEYKYIFPFIDQIDQISCHTIQIRFFNPVTYESLIEILEYTKTKNIYSIEILLEYQSYFIIKNIKELCQRYIKISIITIYNSPKKASYQVLLTKYGNVFYIENVIKSELCCGIISSSYFTVNVKTFTESLRFNSCLNRKVSIDKEGNIKNCPSMRKSFGSIEDTNLVDVIEKPEFTSSWNINKDKILVCKDCEYRYICTDCRAYVEDPSDLHSKPLKCGYNPYTGDWNEWSTNPLMQKAIDFYGMGDMVEKKMPNKESVS